MSPLYICVQYRSWMAVEMQVKVSKGNEIIVFQTARRRNTGLTCVSGEGTVPTIFRRF